MHLLTGNTATGQTPTMLSCVHSRLAGLLVFATNGRKNEMTDKPKIIFAPGCFDNFDGTPEELAAMLADIHQMAENGTLMENSTPLSEEDEAEFLRLMSEKVPRQ